MKGCRQAGQIQMARDWASNGPQIALISVVTFGATLSVSPAAHGAELQTPILNVAEKELANPRKYFVFHKPDVTLEQAKKDLGFCWQFIAIGAVRWVPSFVPWQGKVAPAKVTYDHAPQYGLVGAAIASMIMGPLQRSQRQLRLFRCMTPLGYDRYRTSEAVWKVLNSDDAAQSIELQARIAAGPVPPTPQVLP